MSSSIYSRAQYDSIFTFVTTQFCTFVAIVPATTRTDRSPATESINCIIRRNESRRSQHGSVYVARKYSERSCWRSCSASNHALCRLHRPYRVQASLFPSYTSLIRYDTIRYSKFTCAQKLTRWPA